jgi:hypothetical protein
MSTIHNPVNFDPAHYDIVEYFDNKPPEYHFGMSVEAFRAIREIWEKERDLLFPDRKCYKCVHCGNGNVRYVVCARHNPTNTNVCFGADCAHKLSFANRDELKLAELKAKAELNAKKLRLYSKYQKFLTAHPEIANAEQELSNPVHANNMFVRDVLGKLKMYGELSDRQVTAVINSLKKDHEMAQQRAAAPKPTAPAPEGRVEVEGTVVSIKSKEGYYGGPSVLKMLVVLNTLAKVWVTIPGSISLRKGDLIAVTATFERSKTDEFFAFGKRPVVRLITQAPN